MWVFQSKYINIWAISVVTLLPMFVEMVKTIGGDESTRGDDLEAGYDTGRDLLNLTVA